jgi:uncharacterized membrane protein YhfC
MQYMVICSAVFNKVQVVLIVQGGLLMFSASTSNVEAVVQSLTSWSVTGVAESITASAFRGSVRWEAIGRFGSVRIVGRDGLDDICDE